MKYFMCAPPSARVSSNVLYIMRVCQFRYGLPLLVAITWIVPLSDFGAC